MSPLRGGVDRNIDSITVAGRLCVAPSRGRGSKPKSRSEVEAGSSRPFAGAWIETFQSALQTPAFPVAPSRGRGSKRRRSDALWYRRSGRPFAGAWIETTLAEPRTGLCWVAPSRGRGSKPVLVGVANLRCRSPLRGGVDRNPTPMPPSVGATSRPFAGAWIETPMIKGSKQVFGGSPLRGGVDRNGRRSPSVCETRVAPSRGRGSKLMKNFIQRGEVGRPFAGAWIETPAPKPPRPRPARRPFAGAWIETTRWGHCRRCCRSPLRGGVDRNTAWWQGPGKDRRVAPSRGRGSKPCL